MKGTSEVKEIQEIHNYLNILTETMFEYLNPDVINKRELE